MTFRLVAGSLHGLRSPVTTSWETVFADVRLKAGATMPLDAEHEERAVYVITGDIEIGGDRHGPERLLVLKPGDRVAIRAANDAHFILVGGAPMDGPRHIWWNFVSSSKGRSNPPRLTGRRDASISCPVTRRSSFRCQINGRRECRYIAEPRSSSKFGAR